MAKTKVVVICAICGLEKEMTLSDYRQSTKYKGKKAKFYHRECFLANRHKIQIYI